MHARTDVFYESPKMTVWRKQTWWYVRPTVGRVCLCHRTGREECWQLENNIAIGLFILRQEHYPDARGLLLSWSHLCTMHELHGDHHRPLSFWNLCWKSYTFHSLSMKAMQLEEASLRLKWCFILLMLSSVFTLYSFATKLSSKLLGSSNKWCCEFFSLVRYEDIYWSVTNIGKGGWYRQGGNLGQLSASAATYVVSIFSIV